MSDDDSGGAMRDGCPYLLDAGTVTPNGGRFRLDATNIKGDPLTEYVAHLNIAGAPAELHDEMEVQGFLAMRVGDRLYLDPRDLSWVRPE